MLKGYGGLEEENYIRKVKHSQKIHTCGCFSSSGFGNLILFTGKLNALKLIDLYNSGLIHSSKFLFDGDWTFREDNNPKHTSKLAKNRLIEWTCYLIIDPNPIENV